VHLRWKLGVVVGGGAGAGHEVCLRLARAGAGVLVADRDAAAAEATAVLARTSRVSAWALRVDPDDDHELDLLAARSRDLGGADLVVVTGVAADRAADVAAHLLPGPPVLLEGYDDARLAVRAVEHLSGAEVGAVVVIG
jgi:NAD(P)-dependent dehydrogenase (short-subunit alcohol dehydrogenase family)